MISKVIREYVFNECKDSKNAFGPAFFEQHLLVVLEYGKRLAAVLGADTEIVELAAYLHDIAAVGDITVVPQHHLLGAESARETLQQHSYPSERIERVVQCITSHSAPVQIGKGSPEEVCLSDADAMSQIARPVYWLHYAFRVRQFDFKTGQRWYRQRVESNWSQLIRPAKDIIEKEYHLAQELLESQPGK